MSEKQQRMLSQYRQSAGSMMEFYGRFGLEALEMVIPVGRKIFSIESPKRKIAIASGKFCEEKRI